MKNKNDKRGKSPANFYDRIAEMLGKAAIPQTITVEAEGVPYGTQIVKTLPEMIPRPTYIASCSFGKDSIATILLALEHNEPLDRVVFSEVMFDHARDISGEIPEHIGWIYNTAIPKLHNMGVHVDVVRAERDYRYFFANAVGGGGVTQGRFTGSRSAANAS